MKADIGVIGAGKWGKALHFAISQNFEPKLWGRNYQGKSSASLKDVLECEYIVYVLPAQVTREWMRENFHFTSQKLLIATKGIEVSNLALLNEIFEEFLPPSNCAFLSGPSFAKEVMDSLPTAIVINSINQELAKEFSSFFPNFIKTYISDDVIGAEICGAYKNVLAIAGGVCDGLGLGNNARASMIARGLVEMQRFGLAFGAKEETFLGLSGAGDLFLSASSKLSRNYRVGHYLANGKSLEEAIKLLGEVAEGIETTKAVVKLSKQKGIYTPIASEVEQIISGKEPKQSLRDLLKS